MYGVSAFAAPTPQREGEAESSIQQSRTPEDARRSVEFQNLLGARVAPLGTIYKFRVG